LKSLEVSEKNENKFLQGLNDFCEKSISSVRKIGMLDNNSYDELLSNNIVFIHLVDASAINTVLECILRNTPIIVNKIPAVVEMLGEEYPLYFEKLYEVSNILEDTERIKKAHKYIFSLNKTKFSLDSFLDNFWNKINSIH